MENDFGTRLRQALLDRKMPGKALAAALKVTPGAVANWTTGRTKPDSGRIHEIARLLRVEEAFLLGAAREGYVSLEEVKLELEIESGSEGEQHLTLRKAGGSGWTIAADLLPRDVKTPSNLGIFLVTGGNMEPTLRRSDYAIADLGMRSITAPGVYVIHEVGCVSLKRCHGERRGPDDVVVMIDDDGRRFERVQKNSEVDVLGRVLCKIDVTPL